MTQKRKRNRKGLWVIVILMFIFVIIIGIVIGISNNNDTNDGYNNESEKTEQKDDTRQEGKTESEKKDEEVANQQKPVQYEGDDPNKSEELTGVVTYAGVNDGVLMVRVNIDQYITEGVCDLTLERSGDTIYNSIVSLIGDVSASTCEGFDIPVGGLGGGKTNIIINLNADGRTGTIRGEADI